MKKKIKYRYNIMKIENNHLLILFIFKRGFLPFMRVTHAEGVYDQIFFEKKPKNWRYPWQKR